MSRLQELSHPQDAYVYGTLSELSANNRGVGFLVRNLNPDYNGVPPILERLGNISFPRRNFRILHRLVNVRSACVQGLGDVKTDLKLSADKS